MHADSLLTELSAAAAAKSCQSCPALCDPIHGSPLGSHPWDSPGKNTGVGCHFLLQCMKAKSESEVAQSCPTLRTPGTPINILTHVFSQILSFYLPNTYSHRYFFRGKSFKLVFFMIPKASLIAQLVKNLPANAGDLSLIPGSERSPGGHGNPLQYFCLENPHVWRGHKESDMTE